MLLSGLFTDLDDIRPHEVVKPGCSRFFGKPGRFSVESWEWQLAYASYAAACGTDAAPFFQIFNPAIQAANYDPKSQYIKVWVSELNSPDGLSITLGPAIGLWKHWRQ
jgi:hypothetical protein